VTVGNSVQQTVTISNTGNTDVTISSAGINAADFSITALTAPIKLTAGQNMPLTVNFAPNRAERFSGSLEVASNAPSIGVSLVGTGTEAGPHAAVLNWTASTTRTVVGYNVYRGSTAGGPYTKLNSSSVADLTFTDSTVVPGQTYFYVLTAVDSSGIESAITGEVSGLIPTS
ncbi:MAG: choice-of-anchor D domain-containing protein, partial [Candidatus Acidiferrales bacterium]